MRISQKEVEYIKKSVKKYDPDAEVYLFGSRVDDNARGGDIDLLIYSQLIHFNEKRYIRMKLHELMGEQKIDIVVTDDKEMPFAKVVLPTGIKL